MPSTNATRGTCKKMCPASEIQFRIENNLVHILECSTSDGKSQPNPDRMVKEFSRSAAGSNLLVAEQLRPMPVLEKSVDYLIKLFKRKEDNLQAVYNFIMDRFRAIRQDMVIQRLTADDCILLVEKMLPFYIETEYICSTTDVNFYNWKLHSTQMEDCFSTWNACISKTAKFSQDILFISFFRNLKPTTMNSLLPYFTSENQRSAVALYNAYSSNNFVKFFRLLSHFSSTLIKQCCTPLVHQLRVKALFSIYIAFKCRNSFIPSSDIQRWLLFDSLEDTVFVLSKYFKMENYNILISSFTPCSAPSHRTNFIFSKFDHLL